MSKHDFVLDTFYNEYETTWGNVPKLAPQVSRLCYAASQVCWLDQGRQDLDDRRDLVYNYSLRWLGLEDVQPYRHVIPTKSYVDKYIDSVATLFNEDPKRVFSVSSDIINQDFENLLKQADANSKFQQAYRYALLTNVVSVYPAFDAQGSMTINVLTPDKFCVVTDDEGNVIETWEIHAVTHKGTSRQQTEFRVWTNDFYYHADYQGNPIQSSVIANPYGRIPRTFLRLTEPCDREFYSSGDGDITFFSAWANFMLFQATKIATYQGAPLSIAYNMDLAKDAVIAPGKLIEIKTPPLPDAGEPRFEFANPGADYFAMAAFVATEQKELLQGKGLPAFVLDSSITPPSGIALAILERELVEKRKSHASALAHFEADFMSLLATVVNTDGNRGPALLLPTSLPEFSVEYRTSRLYMEPEAEFAHDMKLVEAGLKYPGEIAKKYLNAQVSDADAVILRDSNKAVWSGVATSTADLKSTVGGSAQIAALQKDYYAGLLPREAAISNCIHIFGFTSETADALFPKVTVTPAQTNLPEPSDL